MRVLIDMNLSPDWVETFKRHNIEALHWSKVGKYNAPDTDILSYAKTGSYIIFTNDLDFGTILALGGHSSPSVLQLRNQDILPSDVENVVVQTLQTCQGYLEAGALVVVDANKTRVRILPLRESN
jgi:predicted nuclease of predicted toxin-antitoxin system